MLRNLFCRRALWSIRVFRAKEASQILNLSLEDCELVHVIDQPFLRVSQDYPVTIADPFLFSYGGSLYLFYEVQSDFHQGEIHVQSMDASGVWHTHGCVLREQFHVSFPNVFTLNGEIYMLPETTASGRVTLYKANRFPHEWVQESDLVGVPLLDPILLIEEGQYVLLGTSLEYELVAYSSDSLVKPFRQCVEKITADRTLSRNGGPYLQIGNRLFRVSQNCQERYGTAVGLSLITGMNAGSYQETPFKETLLTHQQGWMRDGYHGLSLADHNGTIYLALDGRRKDTLVNNYILAWLKFKIFAGRVLAEVVH